MRAWLYFRLSRDEDQEMNSLKNQRQILVDYAEQKGYEIVGESFDDNVSGMTFERKGLGELENAVEENKVDTILVKDLSRLGRHRTQTALFIDYLLENGVNVISVTEGINSADENDDLIIGFKQIVNDLYAKDISKKVRAGIRQKQKTGLVVHLPMGYCKDRNTNEVKIEKEGAQIVTEVFELYLNGYGMTTIAKQMNEKGIKSPEYYSHRRAGAQRTEMCKKFLWTQSTVKRLLQNEIYTGTLVNHKTVTNKIRKTKTVVPEDERYRHENFCEPIIDLNTWKKTQVLIESREKTSARSSDSKIIHRYSGMIKCAECGASLIAKKRTWNNEQYVEYSCNSYNRYGSKYCTPHRIHEDQVDKLLIEELLSLKESLVAESRKYEAIVQDWIKNRRKYEKRMQEYSDKIQIIKNQIEDIIMERISDKEHAELYNRMIAKREEQIKELEKKITDCRTYDEISKKRCSELKSTAELIESVIDEGKISDVELRMLVQRITIHQNEDKSLDVQIDMNGNYETGVSMYFDIETA